IRESAAGMQNEIQEMRRLISRTDRDIRTMGQEVSDEMGSLNDRVESLASDADEIREVVEPLEPAAERLGKLAERFPGPGRKR
ncbi:MAG TPA: hypothetical protein VFP55_13000, partial [Solirubrobacteraceae bacterium]|nr:hypothetical protein [Solirubrobacteraceae bacterium]